MLRKKIDFIKFLSLFLLHRENAGEQVRDKNTRKSHFKTDRLSSSTGDQTAIS